MKRPKNRPADAWSRSPERAELLALYAEADALLAGWACACSSSTGDVPRCCDAAALGREPYPTAVEMAEVRAALRTKPVSVRDPRKLPIAGSRPCPLLSSDGLCRIYVSRPLGCRTFFCDGAVSSSGDRGRTPRKALQAIGQRVAALSARFDPADPRPRSLVSALFARR